MFCKREEVPARRLEWSALVDLAICHMAVKIAKAMGAEVTVFSCSNKKEPEAKALGADLLVHMDEEALKAAARTFDVILDTVSHRHPITPLASTMTVGGTLVFLGAVPKPFEISAFPMLFNHLNIEGSLVGGVAETKEMLSFCAKYNIKPDIKVIHAKDASNHFKALANGTALVERAVIDMPTLQDLPKTEQAAQ